ncbi:DUF4376 domain-containing protein [Lonepinella koalarum]|uniref:DUF4376 domain-containing protein n=1 Tax=Lonepinella koalarum TaxID=53417 RepID=UPI003F6DACC5
MIQFDQQGFALASGEITVYQTNSNNEFSGATTEFVSLGGSLSANSYLDAPPKVKNGFAIIRENNSWQYVEDHRGKTVYSTFDRSSLEMKELGKIPENYTAVAPFSDSCEWNGKKWTISKAKQAEIKANQQQQMREKINAKRDESCYGGIYIESLGKWFDSDETSFVKMMGAKAVMDDDLANGKESTPELWICADNSVTQLNRDDFALIIRTIKEQVSAMHALAVQHKAQMGQADEPLDYDYSQGWAVTYQQHLAEQNNAD